MMVILPLKLVEKCSSCVAMASIVSFQQTRVELRPICMVIGQLEYVLSIWFAGSMNASDGGEGWQDAGRREKNIRQMPGCLWTNHLLVLF
jgi:hypothetical protein